MNTVLQKHIKQIGQAYDQTVDNFQKGVKDQDLLPYKFKISEEYQKFVQSNYSSNSGEISIKNFLNPQKGMNYLDVGSCANLINHKLYLWPSTYFGIDISKKLIQSSKNFIQKNNLTIGGLFQTEVIKLPFQDNFFQIISCIGVLEYFDKSYSVKAFRELNRVLKPYGKMVLDFPNLNNPDVKTMFELEAYLGRPRYNLPSLKTFQTELEKLFIIQKTDDTSIMIKYYLMSKKLQ